MLKPYCDDCQRPINPAVDNFIEAQLALAKDGKIMRGNGLHFCSKECLNSWVVKALSRTNLVLPGNAN